MVSDTVIAASNGKLYALDPLTGKLLWKDGLKGMGYSLCCLASNQNETDYHSTALTRECELARQD